MSDFIIALGILYAGISIAIFLLTLLYPDYPKQSVWNLLFVAIVWPVLIADWPSIFRKIFR